MEGMTETYGCDRRAKDICRVLRLPGFDHVKYSPRRVRLLEVTGKRYTRPQIVQAFATERPFFVSAERHKRHQGKVDSEPLDRIDDAIKVIPADDRDTWLHVGMGLHHEYHGTKDEEEAFRLWCSWSKVSQKYKGEEDQHRHWKSFDGQHTSPVTIRTVLQLGIDHGWSELDRTAPALGSEIPRSEPNESGSLAEQTMASVLNYFQKIGHQPSYPQRQALSDLASSLEALANGTARFTYVCPLPPGWVRQGSLSSS
jgi:Primase C terminal 2 (PriCT-2)